MRTLLVWTACIGTYERLQSLKEMIQSVKRVYPSAIFGVSISQTNIQFKEEENVYILQQERKCSQFEHLSLLNERFNDWNMNDTYVLFMDDDDILLSSPEIEGKSILGYQYIPTDISLMTIDDLHQYPDKYIIDDDFSGTLVPLSIVREYFHLYNREEYGSSLEDIRFMQFIEDKGVQEVKQPYVLRRFISNSGWKSKISNELVILDYILKEYLK